LAKKTLTLYQFPYYGLVRRFVDLDICGNVMRCSFGLQQSRWIMKRINDRSMKKKKEKVQYVSPGITGTSALLSSLLCTSVIMNMQVKELDDMNVETEEEAEKFYFES